MNTQEISVLVPAAAGIIGAFVGATSAFIPNLINEHFRVKREAKSIESALIAEITALLNIADERKYLLGMEQIISHLKTQPEGTAWQFQVNVPAHYSRIYQTNFHSIGIINNDVATDIITFHQLIDAVVQDVMPGGMLHNGGALDVFEQNYQILGRAFTIGRKLRDAHN